MNFTKLLLFLLLIPLPLPRLSPELGVPLLLPSSKHRIHLTHLPTVSSSLSLFLASLPSSVFLLLPSSKHRIHLTERFHHRWRWMMERNHSRSRVMPFAQLSSLSTCRYVSCLGESRSMCVHHVQELTLCLVVFHAVHVLYIYIYICVSNCLLFLLYRVFFSKNLI